MKLRLQEEESLIKELSCGLMKILRLLGN